MIQFVFGVCVGIGCTFFAKRDPWNIFVVLSGLLAALTVYLLYIFNLVSLEALYVGLGFASGWMGIAMYKILLRKKV